MTSIIEGYGTLLRVDHTDDTPVFRCRYYRPEFMRDCRKETRRVAKALMLKLYPDTKVEDTVEVKFKRQDEIHHNPVRKYMSEVAEGFNKDGECNVCNSTVPEHLQSTGCPVCRLYSTAVVTNSKQSEEDIMIAYLTNTTKRVESLSQQELESFLRNIIAVQAIIETSRTKARVTQGVIEREMIKRAPKTKIKGISAVDEEVTPRATRRSKLDKAADALSEFGIDLKSLMEGK